MPSDTIPRQAAQPAPRSRRGIALVSVLWVLVLLSLIAASFGRTARTEVSFARNQVNNVKAEALADAGVYRAIVGLMEPVEADKWRADGTRYSLPAPDSEIEITIQDEIGKIDLNKAQDELLQGLFELAGLGEAESEALVDAIADFRDADDLTHADGAEDADYEAAGLGHGAKDAPFETVEELLQVIGMTQEIYAKVAPALTVYSRRPGFNPRFAPREVLSALPGVSEDSVSGFIDQRGGVFGGTVVEGEAEEAGSLFGGEEKVLLDELAGHPEITRFYTLGRSRGSYTIRAEARLESGGVFVREAVVQITRSAARPFYFHRWRQGSRRPEGGEEDEAED